VVAAKEPTAVEPLEKIKADMEKRIIALKGRRLFEDYLKAEKERASIRINRKYLQ
jgi:hypothetical protein